MANRLSDQEALEFQFQGTPIDPIRVDSDARELRHQLLDAIELDAQLTAGRHDHDHSIFKPLTMEEFTQSLEDLFRSNTKFDSLLDIPEGVILVDPADDFFPEEYYEPPMNALVPTLIVTFIIAAVLLFLRDGIRRLLGRPKQKTGKWGIF